MKTGLQAELQTPFEQGRMQTGKFEAWTQMDSKSSEYRKEVDKFWKILVVQLCANCYMNHFISKCKAELDPKKIEYKPRKGPRERLAESRDNNASIPRYKLEKITTKNSRN